MGIGEREAWRGFGGRGSASPGFREVESGGGEGCFQGFRVRGGFSFAMLKQPLLVRGVCNVRCHAKRCLLCTPL